MSRLIALLALAVLAGCSHTDSMYQDDCGKAWIVGNENDYGLAIGITDDCKIEVVNKWGKIAYMD